MNVQWTIVVNIDEFYSSNSLSYSRDVRLGNVCSFVSYHFAESNTNLRKLKNERKLLVAWFVGNLLFFLFWINFVVFRRMEKKNNRKKSKWPWYLVSISLFVNVFSCACDAGAITGDLIAAQSESHVKGWINAPIKWRSINFPCYKGQS